MIRILFSLLLVLLLLPTVAGQTSEADWTQHIIASAERTFDFKTVTKGAKPEHRFILKNPLQEPMHIAGITSSCTCINPQFEAEKSEIQTYEEAAVTAQFRGDLFDGPKNATITVSIDRPHRAEFQLNIRGEIRNDFKVKPDHIFFGEVPSGEAVSRTLTVTYTGPNSQWRLTDAQCSNPLIRAEITNAPFQVGKKDFYVKVSLDKAAPQGNFDEYLFLIVNDGTFRREIPIRMQATVGTVIKVSPPTLFLGLLLPGKPSPMKNVILRGTKPFRILKVESDNPAIEIPFETNTEKPPKTSYPLPVRYLNPIDGEGSPVNGMIQASIRITTDIPEISPMFYVTMRLRNEEQPEEPAAKTQP